MADKLVDLIGIGNLLESLVAEDVITCEERDQIIANSFTLTPKLWIEQTKAIGIVSKQGKSGGTFAHPMIACEFASWIAPEFKMLLLKLSLDRTKLS